MYFFILKKENKIFYFLNIKIVLKKIAKLANKDLIHSEME
jgi:hypothetical protein